MESTMRLCPSCGKPLGTEAPQGVCPECLMKAGFESDPGSRPGASTSFVPPPVSELSKLFPQLEILELIGKGGMGAVYKARQPGLDRFIALKILPLGIGRDPGFAERFTREARALAKLNHPNIVAVYDFGQASGFHYFLMEYVDGPNLRQLEQVSRLTPRQALQLVPQICEALQFAHDEGVVHRDIKPENVLIDKKGRVKVADFGLAKILSQESQDLKLTGAQDVMGTPHYMAPEQVERPQEVDHRADLYSLGVVFYEMLTGELPMGRFAPPSRKVEVDARLDEVVLRALEKEPALRYQRAREIKTDVEDIGSRRAPPEIPAADANMADAARKTTDPRRQVAWPAAGLIVTGALNVFLLPGTLIVLAVMTFSSRPFLGAVTLPGLIPLSAAFLLGGSMVFAGVRMLRFESYRFAIVGSVLSMLVPPTNIIGLPIGIWALVVLARPEVQEAFKKRKEGLRTGPVSSWRRLLGPAIGALAVLLLVLVLFGVARALSRPRSISASVVREFALPEPPLASEFTPVADGWFVTCTNKQILRIAEVEMPDLHLSMLNYRASLKSDDLRGRAYLEMWCSFPGRGEFFSRGLDNPVTGSTGWSVSQIPFVITPGEKPDRVRLNLVVEGPGTVGIKEVALTGTVRP